jgi:hypothetical protein
MVPRPEVAIECLRISRRACSKRNVTADRGSLRKPAISPTGHFPTSHTKKTIQHMGLRALMPPDKICLRTLRVQRSVGFKHGLISDRYLMLDLWAGSALGQTT